MTPIWVHLVPFFLGMICFTSGMSKLILGFPGVIGPVRLIGYLTPFALALFAVLLSLSEPAHTAIGYAQAPDRVVDMA